jgi:hypothetical protein
MLDGIVGSEPSERLSRARSAVGQICRFYLGPVNRVRPIVAGTVLRSLGEYSVPTANLPVEPDTLPDAPHESALNAARERRSRSPFSVVESGRCHRKRHHACR